MRILALAAALALSACTVMNEHRAPDPRWPALNTIEHEVSTFEMLRRCYQYVSLPMKLAGGIPFACAEINLDENRCDIWFTADSDPFILEHEHLHCKGYDHHGDDQLRNFLAEWLAGS